MREKRCVRWHGALGRIGTWGRSDYCRQAASRERRPWAATGRNPTSWGGTVPQAGGGCKISNAGERHGDVATAASNNFTNGALWCSRLNSGLTATSGSLSTAAVTPPSQTREATPMHCGYWVPYQPRVDRLLPTLTLSIAGSRQRGCHGLTAADPRTPLPGAGRRQLCGGQSAGRFHTRRERAPRKRRSRGFDIRLGERADRSGSASGMPAYGGPRRRGRRRGAGRCLPARVVINGTISGPTAVEQRS